MRNKIERIEYLYTLQCNVRVKGKQTKTTTKGNCTSNENMIHKSFNTTTFMFRLQVKKRKNKCVET